MDDEDCRREFDIERYGEEIVSRIEAEHTEKWDDNIEFADVVSTGSRYEVCRAFLATLQLANTGYVEIVDTTSATAASISKVSSKKGSSTNNKSSAGWAFSQAVIFDSQSSQAEADTDLHSARARGVLGIGEESMGDEEARRFSSFKLKLLDHSHHHDRELRVDDATLGEIKRLTPTPGSLDENFQSDSAPLKDPLQLYGEPSEGAVSANEDEEVPKSKKPRKGESGDTPSQAKVTQTKSSRSRAASRTSTV